MSSSDAALSACLTLAETIGRSTRLEEVFDAALDAIANGLGVSRASILLFDRDGVMRFQAWRGLSDAYRRAVEGHTPWTPRQANAQPIVVPEAASDPDLAPFLQTIRAEGIAALTFVPLVSAGGVIGKFMLYFEEPRALSPADLQLARLFAAQTAFAVDNLRAQAAVLESHAVHLQTLERSGHAAQRLAAIVESSTDAVVSKDLDGVIMSWNRGAETMFGYPAAEAIGQSINLIVPLDRRDEEQVVLSRIRSGEGVEIETIRQRKDGVCIDVALTLSPVRDPAGRVTGVSSITRDITDRKRRDTELTDLHQRLRILVDASAALLGSPDEAAVQTAALGIARRLLTADGYAIWRLDQDASTWRMVHADGLSDAFGRRPIAVADDTIAAATEAALSGAMAIEDIERDAVVATQIDAYRREGIRSMLVCPMRAAGRRAGTLVFYYRTPHAFREAEIETAQTLANLSAAALATSELYEQERSQREIAESATRRARFLADASAVLSQSLDYEHTLAAITQLAVPSIADWCLVDVVAGDGELTRLAMAHRDPAKLERTRELGRRYPRSPHTPGGAHEVVRTGRPVLYETVSDELVASAARNEEHLQLLKNLAISSYMCVPIITPGGTIGAITFVFSGSGRHYSPQDLQLAQSVAARASLAIDNARAYQRANDANRLKDEFLATLSHELRTPLNAILGYAQMLQLGMLDEDRRGEALAVLVRNGETLRQIIDDVLDISRIVAGKLRLKLEPVDLGVIVRSAAATVQPAASAKGVDVQLPPDGPAPPVSGDADRLQQVVWNLLSNAVKFTPRGGRVHVRIGQADGFGELIVTDSGRGIDPDFLPHMFERFRQADSRFAREHSGLGLGLAIVRELVQLHGGSVTAASRGPGTGSTFVVRLPLLAASDDDRPGGRDRRRTAQQADYRLDGVRVLAVDNEPDSLDLVRAVLENAGATVTTARSGPEALTRLREETPDVLLADIGMPEMDGLQLIRTVRDGLPPPASRVPAAALTAYARAEDRISALSSGFQMHIPKPINTVELVIAVSTLARRARAAS